LSFGEQKFVIEKQLKKSGVFQQKTIE